MRKTYIKAALFTAVLSIASAVSAQSAIIAPPDGTISVVKAGNGAGNYSITNPASSADIAITKNGSMMLLGGTTLTGATVSDGNGSVTLDIEEPLSADFDTVESTYITAHSTKTDDGNKYAAATAEKNVEIDMSGFSAASGEITLEFNMLLDAPKKTNLFTIYDENGKKAFEVQLRFRNDTAVYVAYTKDKYNYTPLRTKLLPVDEWVNIRAVVDSDNDKVSLYCNSEEIFREKAMLFAATPTSFAIGTGADDVAVYSGRKLTEAVLEINTASLSLKDEYAFTSEMLSAQVKLFDMFEEIDAKYLYWSISDNSFCNISSDGVLTADIAALTEPKSINVAASLSCSAQTVSTQKEITISSGGTDGTEASGEKGNVLAYLSKSSNIAQGETISVTAVAYNPDETYYVVVPLYDENGKNVQNHVFKMENGELSGRVSRSFDINVDAGTSLTARVFVFDKDFSVNVLR